MSHISTVKCNVTDLDALEAALSSKFNSTLVRGQAKFKSYAGTPNNCKHAIRMNDNPGAYEIGLQQKAQAEEGYELACDFYDGKLRQRFGQDLIELRKEYAAQVAEKAVPRGYRMRREQVGNEIHIYATQ